MTVHNAMTGSELHETKGAAAAAKGQVLIASGAATAVWQALLGNTIMVNQLSDFPTASGGKITLAAATTYLLGADINIGTDYLLFSAGSAIMSHSSFTANVTYGGTGATFRGIDVNATIKDITVTAGTGDVYDFSETGGGNTKILIISDVLVLSCSTYATFTKMRTVILDGNTTLSCDLGVIVDSAGMTGIRITSLALVSASATFVGIDFTGALVNNINIDGVVMVGGTGSVGIKGDAASANVGANFIANVANVQFAGVTTPLSGITVDDIRWNFQGNGSVADTMPDALVSLVANATVTTTPVGVPTLVAGTFVDERASHFTNTIGGRSTYNGERDLTTPIDADLVIDPASGTNKSFRAYIAVNGVVETNSGRAILITSGAPKQITLHWQVVLTSTDYVELYIENETDSVNATVIDATLRLN